MDHKEFMKLLSYDKKSNEYYQQIYNSRKNLKRNWWYSLYYGYLGSGNYTQKQAYKMATEDVNNKEFLKEQKKIMDRNIRDELKNKKKKS